MLSPFDQAAINMLNYAGLKKSVTDVKLLADDLLAVSEEFNENVSDATDEQGATHAVHVLRHRIGGYQNLESYMRCLRVGNERKS